MAAHRSYQSGVRRLMAAVLEDAAWTVVSARSPERVREEVGWLLSTDRTDLFAFETVCDVLGIDPSYLRRRLLPGLAPSRDGRVAPRTAASPPREACSASS